MNVQRIDLNLLRVFQALYETRSVTRAAERFGITQPAMSNALGRLRRLCDDALFVPTPRGMQPTPYAVEIADAVAQALQTVQNALGSRRAFEPRSSDKVFRFHMTDMGQMYFLPPLLARLQRRRRACAWRRRPCRSLRSTMHWRRAASISPSAGCASAAAACARRCCSSSATTCSCATDIPPAAGA